MNSTNDGLMLCLLSYPLKQAHNMCRIRTRSDAMDWLRNAAAAAQNKAQEVSKQAQVSMSVCVCMRLGLLSLSMSVVCVFA